jgi:DNA-binding Xre family transcriptional regulator
MVRTRIGDLAREAGITKAYHFQTETGFPASTASRLFNDEVQGLELPTIDRLCAFFGCEPGELFVRDVTAKAKRPAAAKAAPAVRRGGGKLRGAV